MPSINDLKTELETARTTLVDAEAAYKKDPESDSRDAYLSALSKVNETQSALVKELETADPLTVDFEKRLEQVRREEKEKLYGRQQKLEEEKTASEKRLEEMQAQLEKLNEEKAALEAARKEGEGEGEKGEGEQGMSADSVNTLIEEALAKKSAIMDQEMAAAKAEAAAEVAALKKQLEDAELSVYKETVIKEAGGQIIAEMVAGSTKEEIDNAALLARQTYKRVFDQAAAARAGAEDGIRDSVPTPPSPIQAIGQLEGELTADQIRAMSPEEWAQRRKKLGMK